MKLLKTATVGAAMMAAGAAYAADIPRRAPPPVVAPPPPVMTWTGFYAGLNAGAHWSDARIDHGVQTLATPGFPHGVAAQTLGHVFGINTALTGLNRTGSRGGFIGGGQIGYLWQFGPVVGGFEADLQGLSHSGNNNAGNGFVGIGPVGPADPSNYIGTITSNSRVNWLGTVRARAGYLFAPSLLAYITGGLAYGGARTNLNASVFNDVYAFQAGGVAGLPHIVPTSGGLSYSRTRVGWSLGGGLEWMVFPNVSIKGEYLYYDLGNLTRSYNIPHLDTFTGLTAMSTGTAHIRYRGHIARAGINYHFNFGAAPVAPVVARY